jgi:hypothetical protein
MGEYQLVKIRGKEITDLYQVRLAIWRASKIFKKKTGNYPTHIGFPGNGGSEKFGFAVEFVRRYGAKLITGLYIPYSEVWLGVCSQEFYIQDKAMEWTRKPSQTYEEVRHIHRGRKRSKATKVDIPIGHPLNKTIVINTGKQEKFSPLDKGIIISVGQ